MLGMAGRLKSINIPGSEYIEDAFSKQMVLHVYTSHALIQAAGYLKYIGGKIINLYFFVVKKDCVILLLQVYFVG